MGFWPGICKLVPMLCHCHHCLALLDTTWHSWLALLGTTFFKGVVHTCILNQGMNSRLPKFTFQIPCRSRCTWSIPSKRGSGDSSVSPNGGRWCNSWKLRWLGLGDGSWCNQWKWKASAEAEFEDVRVFNGLIGDTWHVEWTEPQMLH